MIIYDDAFLLDAESHAVPILEGLVRAGAPLRFHTPNALHIRGLDADLARLLWRAGFTTVRLGLETISRNGSSHHDRKVDLDDFVTAARHLRQAGFTSRELGAYLLIGLPGEPIETAADSIRFVKDQGIRPILAYYTPIPHTRLWKAALAASRFDLTADPVFSNNAVFPCQPEPFSWQRLKRLKDLTRM
jgi:radical SAM superfamily enzyme YgiQ (UPF0313 family)